MYIFTNIYIYTCIIYTPLCRQPGNPASSLVYPGWCNNRIQPERFPSDSARNHAQYGESLNKKLSSVWWTVISLLQKSIFSLCYAILDDFSKSCRVVYVIPSRCCIQAGSPPGLVHVNHRLCGTCVAWRTPPMIISLSCASAGLATARVFLFHVQPC